jgi:hypothetical protein
VRSATLRLHCTCPASSQHLEKPLDAYSSSYVEVEFYELRHNGVLGSSAKNAFSEVLGATLDIRRTGVPTPWDPGPGKVG